MIHLFCIEVVQMAFESHYIGEFPYLKISTIINEDIVCFILKLNHRATLTHSLYENPLPLNGSYLEVSPLTLMLFSRLVIGSAL